MGEDEALNDRDEDRVKWWLLGILVSIVVSLVAAVGINWDSRIKALETANVKAEAVDAASLMERRDLLNEVQRLRERLERHLEQQPDRR